MSAPHTTPGPWRLHPESDRRVISDQGDDVAWAVAPPLGAGFGERWPETVANARLIAAAPELYEELKRLVEVMAETANYLGPFDHADRFAVLRAGVLTGRRTLKRARGE